MTTVLHNTGHPSACHLVHLSSGLLILRVGRRNQGKLGVSDLDVAHLLGNLSHHAHGCPFIASGAKHDHVLLQLARVGAGHTHVGG
jgi:hypothetical protein